MPLTLQEYIFERSRQLTCEVRINGVLLAADSNAAEAAGTPGLVKVQISKSLKSPVPVCTVDVNRISQFIKRGHILTVDAGYNGLKKRIFSGRIQDRSRGVARGSIHAMGTSYPVFRTTQIPSRNFDAKTVLQGLTEILDYVGIPASKRNITVPDPDYVMGANSTPKLEKMAISEMMRLLMLIHGMGAFELGDGTLVLRDVDEVPAPTFLKQYSTETDAYAIITDGSDDEDPDSAVTRLIFSGAQIGEGSTSRTVTQTAIIQNSEIIWPPLPEDSYIDDEVNDPLVDDDAQATVIATRELRRRHRVKRTIRLSICGDPDPEITSTVKLKFPEMDAEGRYFVSGIDHTIDLVNGWQTDLELSGDGEGGGSISVAPLASFVYSVEQEPLGGTTMSIVTADSTASQDPDGTIESRVWTCDAITIPAMNTLNDKEIITFAVNPITVLSGVINLTLLVTDNKGLTNSITLEIPVSTTSSEVRVPSIALATGTHACFSRDGGLTWWDQVLAGARAVDCKPFDGTAGSVGVAVFGTATGGLYKTYDGCITALTQVKAPNTLDGQFTHVWWDKNVPTNVWACTTTGRLYLSITNGDSWFLQKDFGGTYPLNRIATPPGNGVWVYGGRGDQPTTLIQWSVDLVTWFSPAIGGELLVDLQSSFSQSLTHVLHAVDGNNGSPKVLGYTGSAWELLSSIPAVASSQGCRTMLRTPQGLYVHQTDGNDKGHLYYSPDAVNWALLIQGREYKNIVGSDQYVGVRDICAADDGTVFVLYTSEDIRNNNQNAIDMRLRVFRIKPNDPQNPELIFTGPGSNYSTFTNSSDVGLRIATDGKNVLVLCRNPFQDNNHYSSPDGGSTWETFIIPYSFHSSVTYFNDVLRPAGKVGSFIMCPTGSGEIKLTDNVGRSWRSASIPTVPSGTNTHGAGHWKASWGAKQIVIFGGIPFTDVYVSTDYCNSWRRISTGVIPGHSGSVDYDPVSNIAYVVQDESDVSNKPYKIADPFGTPVLTDIRDAVIDANWTNHDEEGFIAVNSNPGASAPSMLQVAEATSYENNDLAVIFTGAQMPGGKPNLYYTSNIFGDGSEWKRAVGIPPTLWDGRAIVRDQLDAVRFRALFNTRDAYYTLDGINWLSYANSLPEGTAAHQALWFGHFLPTTAGVYLAPVEHTNKTKGLLKTIDGMQTWFEMRPQPAIATATWPTNGVGWQVAVQFSQQLLPTGTARIVFIDTAERICKRNADDTDWFAPISTSFRNSTECIICPVTKDVWFAAFADSGLGVRGALGTFFSNQTWRTADAGLTWARDTSGDQIGTLNSTALTTDQRQHGTIDWKRAANGDIWALVHNRLNGYNQCRLRVSTNKGLTWDTKLVAGPADGSGNPTQPDYPQLGYLLCHPTNSNIVIAWGGSSTGADDGAKGHLVYTIDGGANWATLYSTAIPTMATSCNLGHGAAIFASGRALIVTEDYDSGVPSCDRKAVVYWSDDYTSWNVGKAEPAASDVKYQLSGVNALSGKAVMTRTYDVLNENAVWISEDFGETWTALTVETAYEAGVRLGAAVFAGQFSQSVYDPLTDTLYISSGRITDSLETGGASTILKLTPATNDGVWSKVQPVSNQSTNRLLTGWRGGIAVIPTVA